jgi:hypothetical protein
MKITIDGVVKSMEDVHDKMLKNQTNSNRQELDIVYVKTLPYGVKSKTRIVTTGKRRESRSAYSAHTPFILQLYFARSPLVLHWHSSGKEVSVEYKRSTSGVQWSTSGVQAEYEVHTMNFRIPLYSTDTPL